MCLAEKRVMNLFAILEHAARTFPGNRAVVCGDEAFTYAEFAERVRRLTAVLAERGVGRAAPLALLHRNCHRYLEIYFAAAALDALFVPLNVRLTAGETAAILRDSKARLLVAESCFLELAEEAVLRMAPSMRSTK